jgi:hypothetical protein
VVSTDGHGGSQESGDYKKLALGQAAQAVKEVPAVEVFDAKVEKLTNENEKLQVLVCCTTLR